MKITKQQLKQIIKEELESPDIQIPDYGIMTVQQVEKKLARMLQEAAEDAMKDPHNTLTLTMVLFKLFTKR